MKQAILVLMAAAMAAGSMSAQVMEGTDAEVSRGIEKMMSSPVTLGRHHISLGLLGYFKSVSGDFELPEWGIDASEGNSGSLNYRYSFTRNFDMAVDFRMWTSELTIAPATITTTVAGMGAGFRYTVDGIAGRIYPYVQANGYNLTEEIELRVGDWSTSGSESAFGYAVNGGIEVRLGSLISIPIEAFYLGGKPADDVSGWGVTGGVSFNWGRAE